VDPGAGPVLREVGAGSDMEPKRARTPILRP